MPSDILARHTDDSVSSLTDQKMATRTPQHPGKLFAARTVTISFLILGCLVAAAELPTSGDSKAGDVSEQEAFEKMEKSLRDSLASDRELLRDELISDHNARLADVQRERDEIYQSNDRVISLMQAFLAFLAFLVALLGIGAFWEKVRISKLRKKAEDLSKRAQDVSNQVNEALSAVKDVTQYYAGMQKNLKSELIDLSQLIEELDLQKRETSWVVGTKRSGIDPARQVVFEDLDQLVAVGDKLSLFPDNKETARILCKLAKYWKVSGQHEKAAHRAKRAIQLDQESEKARRELGAIYAEWAVSDGVEEKRKLELLDEAYRMADEARGILGAQNSKTVVLQAWVEFERGNIDRAIEHYETARSLDSQEARREQRDPEQEITYNLACIQAGIGQLDQALVELESVITECWMLAEKDPDLEPIRDSAQHAKRLTALIQKGRAAEI